jgi:hypothetical protein
METETKGCELDSRLNEIRHLSLGYRHIFNNYDFNKIHSLKEKLNLASTLALLIPLYLLVFIILVIEGD